MCCSHVYVHTGIYPSTAMYSQSFMSMDSFTQQLGLSGGGIYLAWARAPMCMRPNRFMVTLTVFLKFFNSYYFCLSIPVTAASPISCTSLTRTGSEWKS